MMPSSKPYSSVAICDSGTLLPLLVGTARLGSRARSWRSRTVPRSMMSINSLSSRYWLTSEPVSELCRKRDSSAVLTPRARARSWSTCRRTTLLGSSQSRWTFTTCGFSRTLSATWRAMARTSSMCSPDTRNCTG
ncbi:hypothetical protein D9M69_485780 [compost metagenome]